LRRIEGFLARQALLEEVYTSPKPGLVDALSSGAHSDMNVQTFVRSAYAIAPYFNVMAQAGEGWEGPLPLLFPQIRAIGMQAERAMNRATGKVNTHKGLIFSLGILSTVHGYACRHYAKVEAPLLCSLSQALTYDGLEEDFKYMGKQSLKELSHGQQLFVNHQNKGIRGEVQMGFSSVTRYGLPVYQHLMRTHQESNRSKLQVLLHLLSEVEDSNVLFRKGSETLHEVQFTAKELLHFKGAFNNEVVQELAELDVSYAQRRISSGGCADLLAVTLFLDGLTRR